jgi:hypothetical protein
MLFPYQNLNDITPFQRQGSNDPGDKRAKCIESLHHKLMSGDFVAISILMLERAHHCHPFEMIAADRDRMPVYFHTMNVHICTEL